MKRMVKRSLITVLIIILSFNLTGCGDRREIDDQVYTLALGVDKGVDNKIRLTVQYPVYRGTQGGVSQGGGGGNGSDSSATAGGETILSTVEAPSILEGLNLLATSTSRRISLVHTKLMIFSEDFAREGVGGFLQPIARYRETRRVMQVIVCKGTAEAFIKQNTTFIGQGLSKTLELKQKQSQDTGFFPRSTFHEFYRAVLSEYTQPFATYAGINPFTNLKPDRKAGEPPLKTGRGYLPGKVPKTGDVKDEYVGTAVFNGDKMVGALDSYETRYFLMILGEFKRGFMTIEDKKAPGKSIILDIRPGRVPKINARFEAGRPIIDVNLYVEADVSSIQSRYPYENADKIDELNNQVRGHVQGGVEKVIKKTQQEFKTDVFGFGYKVAHNFSNIDKFEKYNWKSHYSEALVNVNVNTNIRRTGLMIRSAPIIYGEPSDKTEKE